MDRIVKLPVRRLAILPQHAWAPGQDAMRLDGRHAALGVYTVPCQYVAAGNVHPVQFSGYAPARFFGVQERCDAVRRQCDPPSVAGPRAPRPATPAVWLARS